MNRLSPGMIKLLRQGRTQAIFEMFGKGFQRSGRNRSIKALKDRGLLYGGRLTGCGLIVLQMIEIDEQ